MFRLFAVNAEAFTFRKKLKAQQTEPSCVVSVQGNMWGREGIKNVNRNITQQNICFPPNIELTRL
jgi:hypothetical protein